MDHQSMPNVKIANVEKILYDECNSVVTQIAYNVDQQHCS